MTPPNTHHYPQRSYTHINRHRFYFLLTPTPTTIPTSPSLHRLAMDAANDPPYAPWRTPTRPDDTPGFRRGNDGSGNDRRRNRNVNETRRAPTLGWLVSGLGGQAPVDEITPAAQTSAAVASAARDVIAAAPMPVAATRGNGMNAQALRERLERVATSTDSSAAQGDVTRIEEMLMLEEDERNIVEYAQILELRRARAAEMADAARLRRLALSARLGRVAEEIGWEAAEAAAQGEAVRHEGRDNGEEYEEELRARLERLAREKPDAAVQEDVVTLEERQWVIFEHARVLQAMPQGAARVANLASQRERYAARFEPRTISNAESAQGLRNILGRRPGSVPAAGPAGGLDWVGQLVTDGDAENAQLLGAIRGSNHWWNERYREQIFRDMLARCPSEIARHAAIQALFEVERLRLLNAERAEGVSNVPLTGDELRRQMYRGGELVRRPVNGEREDNPREPNPGEDFHEYYEERSEEEQQRRNPLADDRDAENERLVRAMLERRRKPPRGGGLRGSLRGGALPLREQEWADQLIDDEDDEVVPGVVIVGAEMLRQVFPDEEVPRERVNAEREEMPVEDNPGEVVQLRGRRLDETEQQRHLDQELVHQDVNSERQEDSRELIPGEEENQPANRLVKDERRHHLDQVRPRQRYRGRGARSPSQEQYVYMDRGETFRASPEEAAARFFAINRATRADLELRVHQLMIRRKRALSEPDQVTIWKKSYRFDNEFESSIRSSMHLRQHGPDDDPGTYQWKEQPRPIHYLATESTKPKHYLADLKERDISELDLARWYNATKAPPLALGYAVGWVEPPWKEGLKEKWVQEHGGKLPVQIRGWPVTADMQDAIIPDPDEMEFERRRKNERIRRRVEANTPIDPPGGWREVNWGQPRADPWDEQIDPLDPGPPLDDNSLWLNRGAYQATQAVNALPPNDVPRYVIPHRTRRVNPPPRIQPAVTPLPFRVGNHPGNAPSRTRRNDNSGFQFDDLTNASRDLNSSFDASNQRLNIASQHPSTMLPTFGGSGGLLPNPMAYAHCPAPTSAPPQHLEGAANSLKSAPDNSLQVLTPSEHQSSLFRRQMELNRMQLRALEHQQVYGPTHTLQTAAGVVEYQHFNDNPQLESDLAQRPPGVPTSFPPVNYFGQAIPSPYNFQFPLDDGSSGCLPEAMLGAYGAALQPLRTPYGLPIFPGNIPSRPVGTDGHHVQAAPSSQTPQQPTDQMAPAAHFNVLPGRAIVYALQELRPPPGLSVNKETPVVPEEFVPNHSSVTTHGGPAASPPMTHAATYAPQQGHPPPVLALNAPGNFVRGRTGPNSHDVPTAAPPPTSMYATASAPTLSPLQLHDEVAPPSQPSLPFNTNMHAPRHYVHIYRRPQLQVPATPPVTPASTAGSIVQAQEPRVAAVVDVPGLRDNAAALTPETPSVGPAETVRNESMVKPMTETAGNAAEGVWPRAGAMRSVSCDGIGSRPPEMRARGVLRNPVVRGRTYTVSIGRESSRNRHAAEEDQIEDPASAVTMRGGSAEDELPQRLMPEARVNVTRDENHAVIMGIVEEAGSSLVASPSPEIIEGARLVALIAEGEQMQPHILGALRSMEPQAEDWDPMQLGMSLSGTTSPDILGGERRVALGEMRADLERIIGALDGAGDRILELMDRDVRNGRPLAVPERQPIGLMGLDDHNRLARNPLVRARSAGDVGGLERAALFGMPPWRRQPPSAAISGAAQPVAFLRSPPRQQQLNPELEEANIEQAIDQLNSDLLFEIDRELADDDPPPMRGALGGMNQHEGIFNAAPIANPLNRSPSPEVVGGAQAQRLNRFQERLEAFGILGDALEEAMEDIAEIDDGFENGDQELMEEIMRRPAPTIPPGFGPSLVQDLEGNVREGLMFGDIQGHSHPPATLRRASDLAGPRTPPMRPRSVSFFGEVRNPYESEFRLSFRQEQSMRDRIATRRAEMEVEAAMRRLSLSSADYTDNSSNAATMTVISEEGIAQDRIDLLLSAPWRPMGPRTIRDYAFEDFVYAVPSGRIGGLRHAQTYMGQIAWGPGGLPVPDIWYQLTFHTRAHHCIDQQKISLMPLAMVKNLLTDTDHWYDLRREVHLALEELAIDPKSEGSCVAIAEFLQALREVVQDLRTQVENGSDREYDVVCEVLKFAEI